MKSQSNIPVLVIALTAITLATVTPVSAAQTNVQIQSADTSVTQPIPGEEFIINVNISNFESSTGPVDITSVYVRAPDSTNEFGRIEYTSSIAAGGSATIPIPVRFDEPGNKRLTVHAVAQDSDGEYHQLRYPVYLEVAEPNEAVLSVADLDPVAGQQEPFNITVSNGDANALSNAQLELDGEIDVENPERVAASIASGSQTTNTFQATFPNSGSQSFDVSLHYTTNEGSTRTVKRTVETTAEAARNDPALTTAIETQGDTSVIRAELAQFGNVELRDVQVRAVQHGEIVARSVMQDVPVEGNRTVALDSSTIPNGPVTVVAEFTTAGEQQTLKETVEYTNDVELDVSNQVRNGSSAIRAELHQFGNVELRDVEIRAMSNGETVARVPMQNVLSEGTQTAMLSGDDIPAGNVTIVATYTAGSDRQTTRASLSYSKYAPAPTSAISLTSIDITRRGDTLTLDGDAANVGTSQVNSVVISVVETDTVSLAETNREYFIENIRANQFSNFEATAEAPSNVDELRLRVEYTVNGQRVSSVIPVDISDARTQTDANQSDGPPVIAIGLVLIVLSLAAFGFYRYRGS